MLSPLSYLTGALALAATSSAAVLPRQAALTGTGEIYVVDAGTGARLGCLNRLGLFAAGGGCGTFNATPSMSGGGGGSELRSVTAGAACGFPSPTGGWLTCGLFVGTDFYSADGDLYLPDTGCTFYAAKIPTGEETQNISLKGPGMAVKLRFAK